jgi:hypothetical protein
VNAEGAVKRKFILDAEGRVVREAHHFLGGQWVLKDAKVVGANLDEFRATHPNTIVGQDPHARPKTVTSPAEVLAALTDEQLAEMGFSRTKPVEGTVIPKDFPGYFPLLRAGVKTREQLESMTRKDIVAIEGIGEKVAEKIIGALSAAS